MLFSKGFSLLPWCTSSLLLLFSRWLGIHKQPAGDNGDFLFVIESGILEHLGCCRSWIVCRETSFPSEMGLLFVQIMVRVAMPS